MTAAEIDDDNRRTDAQAEIDVGSSEHDRDGGAQQQAPQRHFPQLIPHGPDSSLPRS